MPEILPVFQSHSFLFDGEVPDHIEQRPTVPQYVGMYSVFCAVNSVRPLQVALDVPDLMLATQLAEARVAEQEASIKLYRYTDDVYIHHPDGTNQRIYYGYSL